MSTEFGAVCQKLYALKHTEKTYGIDRIKPLAGALENPQNHFSSVQIAGTNGKGSVVTMLAYILAKGGYRCGKSVSPHLVSPCERVVVNDEAISEQDFVRYYHHITQVALTYAEPNDPNFPSFFEYMTAMAWLYFKDQQVDIAILETGLGGEKDANTLVCPQVTAITSISYDHQAILGPTLANIARAKAGIIKLRTPLVLGELPLEALEVIEQIAHNHQAPITSIQDMGSYPRLTWGAGVQRINAAIAVRVLDHLKEDFPLESSVIQAALNEVRVPGRWQELALPNKRTLRLDNAHNEASLDVLCDSVQSLQEPPCLVLGAMRPDFVEMVLDRELLGAKAVFWVDINSPKAVKHQDLSKKAQEQIKPLVLHELFELGESGDSILVTGSTYLIGEVLKAYEERSDVLSSITS